MKLTYHPDSKQLYVGRDYVGTIARNVDGDRLEACWNAVEAIGGDPATVEEMRAALDNCVRLLGVASMAGESLHSAGVTVAARAVLARVGKVKA